MKETRKYTRWSHELYVEKMAELHPNLIVLGRFKRINLKISHECTKCGRKDRKIPDNALRGHGCQCSKKKKAPDAT